MRRLISDVCLFVLLPLWVLTIGIAQAQFNSFPPGVFLGHGARDGASGGGGRTCTDDTASGNFIARISASNALQDAYCNLIKGGETDGWITGNLSGAAGCGTTGTEPDLLYIFATNTTTTANLNLCGTSFGLTQHGTVTFAANTGYTGDGSTGYFDTGFNNSTQFGSSLNSGVTGAYVLTSRTAQAWADVSAFQTSMGGSELFPSYTGSLLFLVINDQLYQSLTNVNAQGSILNTRTSSTNINSYKNNSSFGSVTSSTAGAAIANANVYILARDTTGSGASLFSQDQLSMVVFSHNAFTSTIATAFQTRVNTFMTTQGVNVY